MSTLHTCAAGALTIRVTHTAGDGTRLVGGGEGPGSLAAVVYVILALLFVVGPIVELYLIIQVSHVIGGWQTVALLLVESAIGAWLMKRQGRGIWRRIQAQLRDHRLPQADLVDGGLIIFAGALMLTPGFLTDLLGFGLLIPPTRAVVRRALLARFRHRLGSGFTFLGAGRGRRGSATYDTTAREPGARERAGRADAVELPGADRPR